MDFSDNSDSDVSYSDIDSDDRFSDDSEIISEDDKNWLDAFYKARTESTDDEKFDIENISDYEENECINGNNFAIYLTDPNQNKENCESESWIETLSTIPDFGFDPLSSGIKRYVGNTPIEVFRSIWTDEIMELLKKSTNDYGENLMKINSPKSRYYRMGNFKNINIRELELFFGLCLLGGQLGFPTLRKMFSRDPLYYHPLFTYVMSGRRFEQILKCLNCTTKNGDRVSKISSLIKILISNFQTVYSPKEEIYLNKSLVFYQGRLLRQHIKRKKSKYGIELYELCSPDGYIHNIEIYRGRLLDYETQGSKIDAVVLRLMDPYRGKGHHLFLDNFYTNIGLCNRLLQRRTHCTGLVRSNARGNPKELAVKKLKKGEHTWIRKHSVYMSKWYDTKDVLFLTTKYHPRLVEINKNGNQKIKPVELVEYNRYTSEMNRSDKLISYYSCPRKTVQWYKKIIFHLLDVAVFNSWILYREKCGVKMSFLNFRDVLIKSLLDVINVKDGGDLGHEVSHTQPRDISVLSVTESHFIEKIPVPANYGRKSYFLRCRWCSKEGKRTNTSWRCKNCMDNPPLCAGLCFERFHAA